MDIFEKFEVFGAAVKYDVLCVLSGSKREKYFGIGLIFFVGICYSWIDDGCCIFFLKVLFINECIFDCVYCINRRSNDIKRVIFIFQEIVELIINFYKRNYIEGFFLSFVIKNFFDWIMEMFF